jgi:hypothetical protein
MGLLPRRRREIRKLRYLFPSGALARQKRQTQKDNDGERDKIENYADTETRKGEICDDTKTDSPGLGLRDEDKEPWTMALARIGTRTFYRSQHRCDYVC